MTTFRIPILDHEEDTDLASYIRGLEGMTGWRCSLATLPPKNLIRRKQPNRLSRTKIIKFRFANPSANGSLAG
jgi:hypothetical protein